MIPFGCAPYTAKKDEDNDRYFKIPRSHRSVLLVLYGCILYTVYFELGTTAVRVGERVMNGRSIAVPC